MVRRLSEPAQKPSFVAESAHVRARQGTTTKAYPMDTSRRSDAVVAERGRRQKKTGFSSRLIDLLLHNRSTGQTIAKNLFWLSVSQVGSRLLRAALIIYAARVLGAGDFGVFSYAMGFAGFFVVFTDLGLNPITIRAVARSKERGISYFSTIFWMKAVLVFATASVLAFIAPQFSKIPAATSLIPLVALLIVFDAAREFFIAYFRGREHMEKEALLVMVLNLSIAVFGFYVLSSYSTAFSLIVAYIGSAALGALMGAYLLRHEIAGAGRAAERRLVRPIISAALPLALLGALGVFMVNVDLLMIGWWRTPEEVGFYSAGHRIVQLLYTLAAIFASSIFPALSRMVRAGASEKITFFMERSVVSVLAVAFPLTLGSVVIGSSLISFVYGIEYLPGAFTFQILSLTFFLHFVWVLIVNLIFAYDKQKSVVPYLVGAIVLNLALNALLIPRYGIEGSALGTVLSQILYLSLSWRMIRRTVPFRVFGRMGKIALSSVVMAGGAWVLNAAGFHVLFTILLSFVVYAVLLFVLKERTVRDALSMLRSARRG
jgi:O-antigen/teichoic acid export membrane protein